MSDDSTNLILGDAAAAASEEIGGRRRFFRRRKKPEPPPLTHCENCGAPLTGDYCAQCGQHAIDYRRSVARVLVDAADSIFNWDTKFLRSIGMLLVKPWKLTNDFNAGRRMRYVHPLRLYLLASIAFFLIARLINLTPQDQVELTPERRVELAGKLAKFTGPDSVFNDEQKARIEAARARLSETGALTREERTETREAIALPPDASPIPKTDARRKQRAELKQLLAEIPAASPTPTVAKSVDPNFIGPPLESPAKELPKPKRKAGIYFESGTPAPGTGPFQLNVYDEEKDKPESKDPFERWIESRIKNKIGENGTKAKLFLETLRSNVPTMMLCCIPLFALVLKILYLRRRRYYVEHLVYALHIHSFAYVAVVMTTLLAMAMARWNSVAEGLTIGFLSSAAVTLIFVSIRRVYQQGWFFTTLKFFFGGIIYFFILVFAISATAFVTLLLPD